MILQDKGPGPTPPFRSLDLSQSRLHHLLTSKLAPTLDFAWDALASRQLLVHALSKKQGSLGFHEQRRAKIDGVLQCVLAMGIRVVGLLEWGKKLTRRIT
jgi:hypothetical protein